MGSFLVRVVGAPVMVDGIAAASTVAGATKVPLQLDEDEKSRHSHAFFNSIQNLLPVAPSETTPTLPPIRSTPLRTIDKPMPVPP